MAEDAWNTRDPARVALAYTLDSRWRNRAEFLQGRDAIVAFLTPQVAARARLSADQGALGLPRQSDRRALRLRMARRQRQLVSQLRQRELGVRRARADAPAHRQHQRSADRRADRKYHWPLGPPARRSSLAQRSGPRRDRAASLPWLRWPSRPSWSSAPCSALAEGASPIYGVTIADGYRGWQLVAPSLEANP